MSRFLLSLTSLILLAVAPALALDSQDPRAIMDAVENRDSGDSMTARLKITITDKAGRERTRVVQSRAMSFDGGNRQLILFESPADVRNAGLLSIDYTDGDVADDQWLYLPSLGRTTRIAGSDKSSSFMGTDLTYSDMTSKDADDYDYTMVESSVEAGGEDCWLIEATPRTAEEKSETGYLKTQVWVSKDKLMPVQIKAWVTEGKRLKYTSMNDIKQVDGIWMAHEMVVRTVRNGAVESQSTLRFSDLKINEPSVTAEDFTERRLQQGL